MPECVTDRIPLVGAEGYAALWNRRHAASPTESGLHVARIEHLLRRYGSLIDEVLELVDADPSLGEPLEGADDYLRAEVVYAVLARGRPAPRRRARPAYPDLDRDLRPRRAGRAGRRRADGRRARLERRADASRRSSTTCARVEAERRSQEQPDDETADAVRLGAPEIVPLDR